VLYDKEFWGFPWLMGRLIANDSDEFTLAYEIVDDIPD
jgi:hypothetical protein